jgi:hypothetical protein
VRVVAVTADAARPTIFVRHLPGVVGETRRVCHIVPIPDHATVPDVLVAYCGEQIKPGTAEQLTAPAGQPCFGCLVTAPLPADRQLPDGGVHGA